MRIRQARKADAADMAVLVDMAGHGLPAWLWSGMLPKDAGASLLELGRSRALREEGAFSYRNAWLAETDGAVAGMLTGYREPDEMPEEDLEGLNPVLRPMVELEQLVPGTWYVNVLATYPEYRGRGVGRALLDKAVELARESGATGMSIILQDDNAPARRLYESHGFRYLAARPFLRFPGASAAREHVLLTRTL